MGFWSDLFSNNDKTVLNILEDTESRYSIKYPQNWNISRAEDGVISIVSDKIKGGIYISAYYGITIPDEQVKNFILDSNKLPAEVEQNILNGEENGIKSWYLSYTDSDNNLTCMLAYKRKGDYLLFVSTEIELQLWRNGWKEIFTEVLLSIELR